MGDGSEGPALIQPPAAAPRGTRPDDTKAIVAVVLGGLGIVTPLLVPSIVGLVLGLRIRRRAKAGGDEVNHRLGTWAVALSCASLLLFAFLVAVVLTLSFAFQCPPPTGNATADAAACHPM